MRFDFKVVSRALGALAFAVTLTTSFALAGSLASLQSIDLVSTPSSTEVFLHSGRIIPYRVVLASDSKVVIDIDEVNPNDTVNTNFKGADNVTHVIFQPLSNNQVRLILRGHNLAAPEVSFKERDLYSSAFTSAPTTRGSVNTDMSPISTAQDNLSEPTTEEAAASHSEAVNTLAVAPPNPLQTLAPEASSTQPINTVTNPSSQSSLKDIKPITESPKTVKRFQPGLFSLLDQLDLGLTLQLSLVGLLVLGLGLFIRHKINALRQTNEDDLWEQPSRQQRKLPASPKKRMPASAPRPAARKKPDSDNMPIGLGALKDSTPVQNSVRSQQPLQTPSPQRQALSQYKKQSQAPINPMPRRQNSESLKREIQRSAEIKRRTLEGQQPKPSSKQPNYAANRQRSQAEPLNSNPEVLNFLRSVADMMDKDGKQNVARNIHERVIKPSLY